MVATAKGTHYGDPKNDGIFRTGGKRGLTPQEKERHLLIKPEVLTMGI